MILTGGKLRGCAYNTVKSSARSKLSNFFNDCWRRPDVEPLVSISLFKSSESFRTSGHLLSAKSLGLEEGAATGKGMISGGLCVRDFKI